MSASRSWRRIPCFHGHERARDRISGARNGEVDHASLKGVPNRACFESADVSFFSTLVRWPLVFFFFFETRPLLSGDSRALRCLCSSLRRNRTADKARSPRGHHSRIKEPPAHSTHPRVPHSRQRHRRRRRRHRRQVAGNKRVCAAAATNRHRPLHFSTSFAVRVHGPILDQACRSALARGEKKKRGDERVCRAGGEL